MSDVVRDPDYPDLIGIGDGPLMPCRVTEMSVTMAPTERQPGDHRSGLAAVYDTVTQRVIRYELPPMPRFGPAPDRPIRISYMVGRTPTAEELQRAREAVVARVAEILAEQREGDEGV